MPKLMNWIRKIGGSGIVAVWIRNRLRIDRRVFQKSRNCQQPVVCILLSACDRSRAIVITNEVGDVAVDVLWIDWNVVDVFQIIAL